ncbi:MAG: WecB/TagA/CpsF family glycosyltransferase [Solirubrobacterales bacterium]
MSGFFERTQVLGCAVDVVDQEQALAVIRHAIRQRETCQVVSANAEMIDAAQSDSGLRKVFSEAGLVTPDGIGAVWALRRQGYPVSKRVTGVDLTAVLTEIAAREGWRIFVLGSRPEVLEDLRAIWSRTLPGLQLAGMQHGYFSELELPGILESIRSSQADILLVALGSPRQEFFLRDHLAWLGIPVGMGIGGTLDVLSGRAERAPAFWRRFGLEWLYRLIKEPSRFKRQLALPRFASRVLAAPSGKSPVRQQRILPNEDQL